MNEKTRFYEELSINSHPSLQTQYYDGWVLRFANGYTRRANSVQALYPSAVPVETKIGTCEDIYFRQGLPCIFKVTDDSEALDAALEARGYRREAPTDLMVMDLTDRQFPMSTCIIEDRVTPEWQALYCRLEKLENPVYRETAAQMERLILPETLYCRIRQGETDVACASAVIERGCVCVLNVIVAEDCRRRGYGRRLLESLLCEAISRGARTGFLQVVQGNLPAVRLYEGLGYRKLYTYWYRVKERA